LKKLYALLLLLFLSYSSYAQSIKSSEITEPESVKLIESIASFEVFNGRQLRVAIFTTSNGSGSANLPESDESSSNLLICIAHYDEYPVSKLYSIGPFLKPKVIKKVDSGHSVTLFIEYGIIDKRKTTKVVVSEATIQIQQ